MVRSVRSTMSTKIGYLSISCLLNVINTFCKLCMILHEFLHTWGAFILLAKQVIAIQNFKKMC